MDRHSSSPEPLLGSPPQNTSTPARNGCNSDGGSGSDESIRDEEESTEHSEDDLDEFFKNAEGLSDQTFGDRLYDCSLSTDVEKSLSHSHHHTYNECSTSNLRHFHDLSCSMLVGGGDNSLQSWKEKSDEIAYRIGTLSESEAEGVQDANNILAELLHSELVKVNQENEHLKVINKNLSSEVQEQKEFIQQSSVTAINCIPKVRAARETIEIANLSVCSLEQRNDCSPNTTSESFRLSSYVNKQLEKEKSDTEITNQQEHRICQTSPFTPLDGTGTTITNDRFISLSEDMHAFKHEWCALKEKTKQELLQRNKEMKDITFSVHQIINCYDSELTASKHQRLSDQKHYQEVINTLKDDIKTMKMRNQEMMKHKDHEIRELKSRLPETDDKADLAENLLENNLAPNTTDVQNVFDDSFNSCSSNMEETFTNLTRTKVEYLKLTPSEYLDDEVVDTVHSIPDAVRHILEDKDLKYRDLEKKFESNKRYLEDLTHDRELEREEFQQSSIEFQVQIEDLKRDNVKFLEEKKQMMYQIEDLTTRLKNAEENEMDVVQKLEKSDHELQAAVEKIYELREIVREQEILIDEMTHKVSQLEEEEQKRLLRDELEKQEMVNKKEQPIYKEQDTYGTLPFDVTDEIHHQLQDLARRIQYKVLEMDSFQLHTTRPSSSCSGVASAVSTEDISCREIAGRTSRNFEDCTLEHMGSAILNEIHRLESNFENLLRYDDVFIKKLKDSDLQSICQKTKIEELESQIAIYQEKCSKQMLKIADLEGRLDTLRFESANQNVVTSLQSRLGTATKQLDELRILLASKETELTQVKVDLNAIRAKHFEKKAEKREASSQTNNLFEETVSYSEVSFEGVSPEKIRRMDTANPLNASAISLHRTLGIKDSQAMNFEPEMPILESFNDKGRTGKEGTSFGGGDRDENCAHDSSAGEINIKEMDENLQQLQLLLQEKDKEIQKLNQQLLVSGQNKETRGRESTSIVKFDDNKKYYDRLVKKSDDRVVKKSDDRIAKKSDDRIAKKSDNRIVRKSEDRELRKGDNVVPVRKSDDKVVKKSDKCEQESVVLETQLNPDEGRAGIITEHQVSSRGHASGSDGDGSMYEITYSHDYEVEGDLLKYLGTKLLHQGIRTENMADQGERRVLETDRQIEIATLNTLILQLKRGLEEEKRKSEDFMRRLKSCEEEKAEMRSRSPMTRAPVQNIVSSVSVQHTQQRELVRQVEEGRKLLKEKEKEIRSLTNHIIELDAKLNGKDGHEKEMSIRLNKTIAMLKRCEEHGRELTTSNQEQVHEIRRLRTQLDRANVNRNNENLPQSASGNEYFENFMRAKSHRKALAWQKKYLSSVILGYKSILRINGHGSEHPDLLQNHIPIAPGAVGYLDIQSPKTKFRVGVLTVIATLRMRYMVSRWCKKRPGETSPESEYKASKHSSRVDPSIIRPRRAILVHSRVNTAHSRPPVDNNINTHETRSGNLGDISEYLSRFASLENEIASSLSRNLRPSK